MKKQDNFLKEVVSFLKKLLVSRKQLQNAYIGKIEQKKMLVHFFVYKKAHEFLHGPL